MDDLSVSGGLEQGRLRYATDLREAEIRRLLKESGLNASRAGLVSRTAVWTGDRLISLGHLLITRFGSKAGPGVPGQLVDQAS